MLSINPYDKVSTYNMWFTYDTYQVVNCQQNNQNMRVRMIGAPKPNLNGSTKLVKLTPLVFMEDPGMSSLKSVLQCISVYQPFYPETFYIMYDFMSLNHIKDASKVLHIGRESKLGSLEAIMMYMESNCASYQSIIYNYLMIGPQPVNYLSQAFTLSPPSQSKYDLISIDTLSNLSDIFDWDTEEKDLQCTLYFFVHALSKLNKDGRLIIKLNLIGRKSWSTLFHYTSMFFSEFEIHRPKISHPFNSEVYLYLNGYTPCTKPTSLYLIKSMYKSKLYQLFHLNLDFDMTKNKLYDLFIKARSEWNSNAIFALNDISRKQTFTETNNWFKTHGLPQVSVLKPYPEGFVTQFYRTEIKISVRTFKFKPVAQNILNRHTSYIKLQRKRAELNFYKRAIDTRPSDIFADQKVPYNQRPREYMLTWNHLTSKLDPLKKLKAELRSNYNVEMATNAWIKMFEILTHCDLIPNTRSSTTFHICEAPGAFVSAVNHFISDKDLDWKWFAQTLQAENALDDHYGLIAKYPDNWFYGNITDCKTIKSYAKSKNLQEIDLVTADGGFMSKPNELNEQETTLSKLTFGQIVTIFACTPIGKNAVLKTFLPLVEPLTISLFYLLTIAFEKVELVKPSGSHAYNSEIYVVLKNYKGVSDDTLNTLYILLEDPEVTVKSMLFGSFDETFLETYFSSVTSLIDRQIEAMKTVFYYYFHYDQLQQLERTDFFDANLQGWIRDNPIPVLGKRLL